MKKTIIYICVILISLFVVSGCTLYDFNIKNSYAPESTNITNESPLTGDELIEKIAEEIKEVFVP